MDDGNGGTDMATLEVIVEGVNNDPDAADDSFTVADSALTTTTLSLFENDNDSDVEGQSFEIASVDTSGLLGDLTIDAQTGEVVYDQFPTDSFDVLCDGQSATETFTYTITLVKFSTTIGPDATGDPITTFSLDSRDDVGTTTNADEINQALETPQGMVLRTISAPSKQPMTR